MLGQLIAGEGRYVEVDPTRWVDLVRKSFAHEVAVLLADALSRRGCLAALPAAERQALLEARRVAALLDEARTRELREVVDACFTSQVRPILIKGAALAYSHYPQSFLRPRRDADLLIPRHDVAATRRVLEGLGYHRPNHVESEAITSQFHYYRTSRSGVQHALDVHVGLADPKAFADLPDYAALDGRTIPLPGICPRARGAGAVDALLIACVHRVAHHNDADLLLWLYDIHLLAERCDAEEWRRFSQLAAKTRMRAVCGRGLAQAATRFGTRVPEEVVRLLGEPGDEPSARYLGGELRLVDVHWSNLRALSGWRDRLRFARHHLFPPPEYMLRSYGVTKRAWLPMLYAHRAVRGAIRWWRPL